MRTRMVYRYVAGPAGRTTEHQPGVAADLRGHEHENRLMAAEVMRANGDLDTVCDCHRRDRGVRGAARLGRPVGAQSSVGTHIFEEFVEPGCPTRACG